MSGLTRLREQQVHISCLGNDRQFTESVSTALAEAGIRATASTDLSGEFRAEEDIATDIRDAAVIVLLCSEASLRDRKIRQELHLAWRYNRPIVPILLQPLLYPDDVVYWLEGAQWIEAFDEDVAWQNELLLSLAAHGMSPSGIDTSILDSPGRRSSVFLPQSDVPAPPGRLVSRERELRELSDEVKRHRLVTLTGSGGTGKTRLALELARVVQPLFPDGIFFVELGATTDPDAVPEVVARKLRIEPVGNEPFTEAVVRGLRDRRLLLILDNFEHVQVAGEFVAELLRSTGSIGVLITSRAPTDLPGEVEFELGPLTLPDPDRKYGVDELSHVAAVELFVERARGVYSGFELTKLNAESVATLCSLLDGVPLAIELMAGKARLLTPVQMLKRFAGGIEVLSIEGGGGRPSRQRTLRDTIEWSVELLTTEHRQAFVWMGVFSGGATLESIETVFGGVSKAGSSTDSWKATESLVQQHLVSRVDQGDAEPRFRMLESIRAYAQEALEGSSDADDLRRSHASHYLTMLQEADAGFSGTGQASWLDRIDADYENCRSAMEWAFRSEPQLMVGALSGLWTYWTKHGGIYQGLSWIEGLALELGSDDLEAQSKLLNIIGNMACDLGDFDLAESSFRTCRELARRLHHQAREAVASVGIGHVYRYRGDYNAAREWYGSALLIVTELNDIELMAGCLDSIADTLAAEANFDEAIRLHKEALVRLQEIGDPGLLAYSYCRLGDIDFQTHDLEGSRFNLNQAIALHEKVGDIVGIAFAQVLLSKVERADCQIDLARDLVLQALTTRFNERLTMLTVETIEEVIIGEEFAGSESTNVSLLAMCDQFRSASSSLPLPAYAELIARGKENLLTRMKTPAFESAWQAGRLLDIAGGVRLTVELVEECRSLETPSEQSTAHNTQREQSR